MHIIEDIRAYKRNDPAARSALEILLLYNGLHATIDYRIAHWLHRHGCRFLARAISQWSKMWTGIEIHPGAHIGRRLVIDHGTGIVIGETAEIGDDCLLYLQPEWSVYERMMPLLVEYAKAHPQWNISIQTHKFMHIP